MIIWRNYKDTHTLITLFSVGFVQKRLKMFVHVYNIAKLWLNTPQME